MQDVHAPAGIDVTAENEISAGALARFSCALEELEEAGRALLAYIAAAGTLGPGAADAVFTRSGELWRVRYEGSTVLLRHAKGFRDLACLLARPFVERHVLDLMLGDGAGRVAGDAGPVIDRDAIRQYRSRTVELRDSLAEAEAHHDLARAALIREELDFLAAELAAGCGLGGRERRTGDAVERARKAVTWRIRHAVGRIEKAHPSLGAHLARSVRTGVSCCYEPPVPITWHV